MYFFDYNTVEAVLQGCAVLVNTNIGLYLLSGGPAGVCRSRLPVWRNVRGEKLFSTNGIRLFYCDVVVVVCCCVTCCDACGGSVLQDFYSLLYSMN